MEIRTGSGTKLELLDNVKLSYPPSCANLFPLKDRQHVHEKKCNRQQNGETKAGGKTNKALIPYIKINRPSTLNLRIPNNELSLNRKNNRCSFNTQVKVNHTKYRKSHQAQKYFVNIFKSRT